MRERASAASSFVYLPREGGREREDRTVVILSLSRSGLYRFSASDIP